MATTSAGEVLHVTARGSLIVKAPALVPVGTFLVDQRREPVGRVADVIGPVKAPYLVVAPAKGAKFHRLVGKALFPSERSGPRGPPPRGRR
ncbi:MAG TPA: Gar1/Naf1 family protein [Candidatus Thermoplasmatota archaeon]|nr:Gar1/Naf1 family protein [Candidatus Thermoplasmatota archaeon]